MAEGGLAKVTTVLGVILVALTLGILLAVPHFPRVLLLGLPLAALLAWVALRFEPRGEATTAKERLIRQLRLAYSGERAAALAYAGHSRAVRDVAERDRIAAIEEEEWHHRRLVGEMLRELGAEASTPREWRAECIGRVLAFLCHLAPWFFPMYGAGRLERGNVKEYEDAGRFAIESGYAQFLPRLLDLAETEWEHEAYFRGVILGHPLLRVFPLWVSLPPKESIRSAFGPAPAP